MDQIREYLLHFSGPTRYAVFFFMLGSCCVGFPLNSDIIVITAAVLAAAGVFDLRILMPLALIALLCGDSITFFVGRRFGREILDEPMLQKVVKPHQVLKAEHYLNTQGTKYLFIVRFLPLIRTALYLTAGCLKVSPQAFYLMDATSTALYLFLLMTGSYYASEHIHEVLEVLKKIQFGLLGVIVAALLITYFYKRKRKGV